MQVGDRVIHKSFKRWGMGVVVEERSSKLPGGFCYVRISFQDGKTRVFDNNYRSECCCYYAGIEIIEGQPKYLVAEESESEGAPKKRRKALPRGEG